MAQEGVPCTFPSPSVEQDSILVRSRPDEALRQLRKFNTVEVYEIMVMDRVRLDCCCGLL